MARIDVALDVSHLLMSTFQSEKMRKRSEKSLTRLTSQSLGWPMRHVTDFSWNRKRLSAPSFCEVPGRSSTLDLKILPRFWASAHLYLVAPVNISSTDFNLEVSQAKRSWSKADASLNIKRVDVTLAVSHLLTSALNAVAPQNLRADGSRRGARRNEFATL